MDRDPALLADEGAEVEDAAPLVAEARAGGAELSYAVKAEAEVRLEVFDLLGRRRAVLESGAKAAGRYRARWEASGRAGIYFARLTVGRERYVQRFALVP